MKTTLNFIFNWGMLLGVEERRRVIICHCKAVNDRAIRQAVRSGANTRRQVSMACAAGRACGGCVPAIDAILTDEMDDAASSSATCTRLDHAAAG